MKYLEKKKKRMKQETMLYEQLTKKKNNNNNIRKGHHIQRTNKQKYSHHLKSKINNWTFIFAIQNNG